MKFSLKNLKKHLIVTWGFSYVLIISIMLIFVIMISLIYNNTSKKYLNEFNDYIFETVARDTNDTLLSMNRMCFSITHNIHLSTLLTSMNDIYTQDASYDFIHDLNSYEQFSDNIDNFFVYIKSSDSIISPDGIYNAHLYHTINFNPAKISFNEWKKAITNSDKQLHYSEMFVKDTNGRDINTIALTFLIPHSKEDCVGVILSNKNNFVKGLENIHLNNRCDVYIYNSTGNLVTYNKQSLDSSVPKHLKEIFKIDSSQNTIHTANIAINGQVWQVVTVVSKKDINRGLFYVQATIIGLIIFSLVILYYVTKSILNKNYSPIKTLLSFFNITDTQNEYENLFYSISSVINQNKSLTKDLDTRNQKLKQMTLAMILRGESLVTPDGDSLDFNFTGSRFCVLTFYLDDISELFNDETSMTDSNRLYHLSFIVENVISEIMNENLISVNTTEMDGKVVCLINFEKKIREEEIKNLACTGLDFINKNFNINLTFALSEIFESSLNISLAYSQTIEVLEHQRILGITEPMQYINTSSSYNKNIFDLHKEQLLITSIKTGNHQAAIDVLDLIFNELKSCNDFSFDYIIYVVLDIACTITKAANYILPSEIDVDDSLMFYRKIKNGENLSSLYTQMSEYIISLCETIQFDLKEGKNRTHFLVSHIEKYIHDNYSDPNLTVYSIGLHFNIKADYISKIFKKEVGSSLLTYITQYRVERALALTKEGKYSKKQIAEMVGFASERNFYRVLKKYGENNI